MYLAQDEDLVVTLVKPVEICIIFVSLLDYPIGHIPQFIWSIRQIKIKKKINYRVKQNWNII
jgi:hypothetical protein